MTTSLWANIGPEILRLIAPVMHLTERIRCPRIAVTARKEVIVRMEVLDVVEKKLSPTVLVGAKAE